MIQCVMMSIFHLQSEKRRRERLEKDSNSFRERTNARNDEELKKVKEELDTLRTTHKGQVQDIPLTPSVLRHLFI